MRPREGPRVNRSTRAYSLGQAKRLHHFAHVGVAFVHELFKAFGIGIDDTKSTTSHETLVILAVVDFLEGSSELGLNIGRQTLRSGQPTPGPHGPIAAP